MAMGERMARNPDPFIPTRQSLLVRLKDWADDTSWRDFFNTYWKLIYGVAIKAGLTDAEAQDVVQETVIAVAKKIPAFQYDSTRGTFKAWLLQITRRRIVDQFRKRQPVSPSRPRPAGETRRTATIERVPAPESLEIDAAWDEEWQKNLYETALEKVKQQVTGKQFQIFELYAVKNWPVQRVAETLGVSTGQVYLAKHRITELLKAEVHRLETKLI
jgi:RNA polymerase sigma factor (sigma-70 family)